MTSQTHMRREILEIPDAVATLLTRGAPEVRAAARALQDADPAFLISVARGSSDHAATYFKYATELVAGIPVASVGPSVTSIYGRNLRLSRGACLAISQSGKSPDIVRMAEMATAQGAVSIALTNHINSDLAGVSTHAVNLHAGVEHSVAATKTFVTSAVSAIWLMAEWQQDHALLRALHDLPQVLKKAAHMDWSILEDEIVSSRSLFCLGRGPALAIANEAALKFKETCQLHAESYSSAEVLHGPVSIIERGFPVIALAAADQAEAWLVDVADQLAAKGAHAFVTSDKTALARALPCARTSHLLLDPLALIVSFYAMVEQVARARGINPDAPRHLRKVTETL
ncbi:SIS domain-containing protein [Roseobacter denitrificans]|uniref:SIS domain protein n=1 Tax=Roseobacter denitrificans (strain ATCC 33942 / OCh 114) TaxID=375451 RepID=Q169J5_ROSDO|nr:SIS domain-containing protein [Roseobacter denitrificans]ABG31348.1 SIS domain protein [Roseobacter denitrificans OCh 114]AVL54372.1 SIS domain-containing protein [Roseobacter denitrificans]SFF99837.1 glutamine--fructose-6-phosphate transaminase [Roseobacter denitrificans OCh 114]